MKERERERERQREGEIDKSTCTEWQTFPGGQSD